MAKKLKKRKRALKKRVEKRNWEDQPRPVFSGSNIYYEFDGRQKGISNGGIGAVHIGAKHFGLIEELDKSMNILKRHLPYHDSDHFLNIIYNILAGGSCLQDIELLRNDEAWLDALGAPIIPAPTTAGDFLRRFDEFSILQFMEAKNRVRRRIWEEQPKSFRAEAIINVDGSICPTFGECKEGMDISYDGQWGYHPLIVSLANTREVLYVVNRPGNVPSHTDSAIWIDKSIDLVSGTFSKIRLRGDTDFSLTGNFDKWDKNCTFVFGMDARKNLIEIAMGIQSWEIFEKPQKHQIKTRGRKRPENIKEQIVKRRKFENITTEKEEYAEFTYQPGKCEKSYRMVVLKKTIKVIKGELKLFDDIRYFFYITNDQKSTALQVITFYRDRADHENDIDQLKHGVKALQLPSDTLLSNWAYMAIASTAWDLKTWYGLMLPYRVLGKQIVRMEFKRFVNTFIRIPCIIIKTGRRICYRIVGYNDQIKHIINFVQMLKAFHFT